MGCLLDAAQDLNVVERKGSWYAYKGKNVAQGRHNVVDLMKQDSDLVQALEMDVREALSKFGKQSTSVDVEDEVEGGIMFEASIEEEAYLE
jgi:recombination protein RecA